MGVIIERGLTRLCHSSTLALRLPLELLLLAFLVPIVDLFLWRHDRRARLIWFNVIAAICGGIWFTLRNPRFDQNSLSIYNGVGTVTIEGVIAARLIWLSVLAAILGGVRFTVSVPHFDQHSLSTCNGRGVVTIEGVITGPPDVRDTYLNLRVDADRLTLPDRSSRPIEGILLMRPSRPAEFRYGDRVRVTGELNISPEFATFSHADFLARQSVYSLIDHPRITVLEKDQGNPLLALIYGFRDRAYEVIQQILPEQQASLLSGILLGVDAGLPQDCAGRFSPHRHI